MESDLSRREREIVDILYAASGDSSAADVRQAISDPPADSTVRTLLRILVEKGHVKQRLLGRRYVYRPQRPKSGAGKSAMRRVVDVFYGGSVEDALAAHLSDPKTKLDDEQLARLKDLIESAAAKGKPS